MPTRRPLGGNESGTTLTPRPIVDASEATTDIKRFAETVEQGLRPRMAAGLEFDGKGTLTSR